MKKLTGEILTVNYHTQHGEAANAHFTDKQLEMDGIADCFLEATNYVLCDDYLVDNFVKFKRYNNGSTSFFDESVETEINLITHKGKKDLEVIPGIMKWFEDYGIENIDINKQVGKVIEEINESIDEYNSGNMEELLVEMGDVFVTNIGLSMMMGIDPFEAMQAALNKIQNRKAKVINGTIVKEADFNKETKYAFSK